ncbi:MAG: hypothetical protein RL547_1497, partial [Actinomycetota bacterium]
SKHDDGVFHEDRVGAIVGGWHRDDVPAEFGEYVHVAAPLAMSELGVDWESIDVRDQTLGETRAR